MVYSSQDAKKEELLVLRAHQDMELGDGTPSVSRLHRTFQGGSFGFLVHWSEGRTLNEFEHDGKRGYPLPSSPFLCDWFQNTL